MYFFFVESSQKRNFRIARQIRVISFDEKVLRNPRI